MSARCSDAQYPAICTATSTDERTPINATGTELTDDRGIVQFMPASDEFDAAGAFANFSYKFVDRDDATLESAEATVTITISAVNDAPVGAAQSASVSGTTIFSLGATDADEDAGNNATHDPSFAHPTRAEPALSYPAATARLERKIDSSPLVGSPHAFAKITSFARAGTLHQVGSNGALGEQLDATVENVPIVSGWVRAARAKPSPGPPHSPSPGPLHARHADSARSLR